MPIKDIYEAEDRNLFLVTAAVIDEVVNAKIEARRKANKDA